MLCVQDTWQQGFRSCLLFTWKHETWKVRCQEHIENLTSMSYPTLPGDKTGSVSRDHRLVLEEELGT
jgi:hypothetical protein